MTLPPLTIVLTAAGCPGAATLIRMLKANGERELRIVGVDMRADAVGRFLCDGFETVPPGASDEYLPALAAVVERERPDVLFVQSSAEVGPVARSRATFADLGARVLVASPEAVEVCSDKAAMHAALAGSGVPEPRVLMPSSLEEFVGGARTARLPGRAGVLQAAGRQRLARLPRAAPGRGRRTPAALRARQQPAAHPGRLRRRRVRPGAVPAPAAHGVRRRP